MAIIDWNDMKVGPIDPSYGMLLFLQLIVSAGSHEWDEEVLPTLTEEMRSFLRLEASEGRARPETVDPYRMYEGLSYAIGGFAGTALCVSKEDRGKDSVFCWKGQWTADRELSLIISGGVEPGDELVANIRFSTGTGRPSSFLKPFCDLAIRQALTELAEAVC